jgi:hypothetical protein
MGGLPQWLRARRASDREAERIRRLTAQQDAVEEAARAFLKGKSVPTADHEPEPLSVTSRSSDDARGARRTRKRMLVRFGEGHPDRPGVVADFSETGLFIITDRPASLGSQVSIDLRMPDGPVPLTGEVIWIREIREPGRSVGFGLRLTDRPMEYVQDVRALQSPKPEAG